MLKAPLIVVSGASGSGKTTLCRRVADRMNFFYGISHTTRSIRQSEKNGVDYYFLTRDEFENKKEEGGFLEWAQVYGNFYGTSKDMVFDHLNLGRGVILDVDTQGADSIKKVIPEAVTVFISVPSLDELKRRLLNRSRDSADEIERRLNQARLEESKAAGYDHVIVNSDLDQAYQDLKSIIENHR